MATSGEYVHTPPYAPVPPSREELELEDEHRAILHDVPGDLGPARHIAKVTQRAINVQLGESVDRLTEQAHESVSNNPQLTFDSASTALHGINRAKSNLLQHAWHRVRHGERYRAIKPSPRHKMTVRIGLTDPFQDQLVDREARAQAIFEDPALTPEEQSDWGDTIHPESIKELKGRIVDTAIANGYDKARIERLIKSGGIAMYPGLVREYFGADLRDVPPHIRERANFLLRLRDDQLEDLIDARPPRIISSGRSPSTSPTPDIADVPTVATEAEVKQEEFDRATEEFYWMAPRIDYLYDSLGHVHDKAALLDIYSELDLYAAELRKFGIEGIEARIGGPFNPAGHNAIGVIGEGNNEEIGHVVRLGFQLSDGRVIRPADVMVRKYENEKAEDLEHGTEVEVSHEDDENVIPIERAHTLRNRESDAEEQAHEHEPSKTKRARRGSRGGTSEVRARKRSEQSSAPASEPTSTGNEQATSTSGTERIDKLIGDINQEYLYELAQIKGNLSEPDRLNIQQSILRRFVPPFFGVKNLSEVPDREWARFADEIELTPTERDELRNSNQ